MAKCVTRNPVGASSKQNLMECGLLSVNQMVIFRILMIGLQALRYGQPVGLSSLLKPAEHGFFTRGSVGIAAATQSHYSNKSWKNKFTKYFLKLPPVNLRSADVICKYDKDELKDWIFKNVVQIPRTANDLL